MSNDIKTTKENRKPNDKAAWIGGISVIIAAIIGGLLAIVPAIIENDKLKKDYEEL